MTPEAQFIPHSDEPTTPTMQIHDEVIALRRENAELRKALRSSCDEERSLAISEGGGHGVCGLARELRAENAELREALNLAFSIKQMSDQQLKDLIENCRKVIGSKP